MQQRISIEYVMYRPITLALLLCSFSSGALAACDTGNTTVFSCTTAKGKVIQVCDARSTIDYSYGKPAKPEIVLHVPRRQTSTQQWNGTGRDISYAVNIPNQNTVYSVFWSADRLSDEHGISAGVNVEINHKYVATVSCSSKRPIISNIEGINLPEAQ